MKNKRWIAQLGVLACALSAFGVQAQQAPQPAQGQTAEGAQKFLAAVARTGNAHEWFVDAQGRTNYVRGTAIRTTTHVGVLGTDEQKSQRAVEKQLPAFTVSEIDTQAADGKPDACLTRIPKWEAREPLVETRNWTTTDEGILIDTPIVHAEISTYEPAPELLAPHWIDWRNVKLNRATNGAQMTASFKEKHYTAHLAFTGEAELLDRIEYAMKFLKLSCDDTSATGF